MVSAHGRWRYYLFIIRNSKSTMAGLGLLSFILFFGFIGPYIYPRSPTEINLSNRLAPPSADSPFGTDEYGRDLLSRVINGARYTLSASAISVVICILVGAPLGGISGFSGKKVDITLMGIADVMLAFPSLVLAMSVCAALGPSLANSAIAVGITYIPKIMRLVRSKVLVVREMEYVQAAKAIGAQPWRVFLFHVLQNSISPVFVAAMIYAGYAILWTTGLSFIGLGAQPPTPEWGLMILKGRDYILTGEWWLVAFPGIFIAVTIGSFILIGDGLRDTLSPKLRV